MRAFIQLIVEELERAMLGSYKQRGLHLLLYADFLLIDGYPLIEGFACFNPPEICPFDGTKLENADGVFTFQQGTKNCGR